ncbi:MAG: hypothetical protein GX442_15300 [Candidatus Riflebacteria bacterium]|nr:hypothetical protein [Candidatus Riflebacteria bacterium]
MTKKWPPFLRFREQRIAWGTALSLVAGWAVFLGASMAPGPAAVDLSFPPDDGTGPASAPAGGRPGAGTGAPAVFLPATTPASFAALFGILPAPPAPASHAPPTPLAAVASLVIGRLSPPAGVPAPASPTLSSAPPARPAPPPPDLTTLGYRLRGIIRGDPETTAVFLWDPKAGREVLVRRAASGAFRLLRVADREVELETPLGSGVLSLAVAGPDRGPGNAPRGGGPPPTPPPAAALPPSPPPSPSPVPNAGQTGLEGGHVLDLLNSRAWRPVQERGHWVVAIDSLPPGSPGNALGLQPGDRILAVGDSGFTRPEEISQRLAGLSGGGRLVVLRGGRLVPLQITTPGNGQAAAPSAFEGPPPRPNGPPAQDQHGFPSGGALPTSGGLPGPGATANPSGIGLPPPGGQSAPGAVPVPSGGPPSPPGGLPADLPPGGVPQAGR